MFLKMSMCQEIYGGVLSEDRVSKVVWLVNSVLIVFVFLGIQKRNPRAFKEEKNV